MLPVWGAADNKAHVVLWEPWEQHLSLQITDHVCAVRSGALFCRDDLKLRTGGWGKQIILWFFGLYQLVPLGLNQALRLLFALMQLHMFFTETPANQTLAARPDKPDRFLKVNCIVLVPGKVSSLKMFNLPSLPIICGWNYPWHTLRVSQFMSYLRKIYFFSSAQCNVLRDVFFIYSVGSKT